MMNDVRFLGGHGTAGPDGRRENPYNNAHSADPDLARRWDSQYPSLWVTDGGGGTFFDIWTPSTFAQAGLLVSNTSTSGRVYEMSAEHHVRHEVQLHRVSNWELHALQTEGERGESGFDLPLEIRDSSRITVSNLHVYRVISSDQPFPWAVKLTNAKDIRFRGFHCYSNSKVSFDTAVFDDGLGVGLRQREFAWLDVSGDAPRRRPPRPVRACSSRGPRSSGWRAASTTSREALSLPPATSTSSTRAGSGSIAGPRRSAGCTTVADAPLSPVNLAFDAAGNLLVVSYAGNGTVYALRPEAARPSPALLAPQAGRAAARASRRSSRWATGVCSATPRDGPLARSHHYLSPDGSTFVSATQAFVDGAVSWGVKSSDLIRTFGLQRARPGERVYLTSEAEVATWSALVGDDGSLSDLRLFVDQGGEGVAADAEGNVYLAAGDVHVYDPPGRSSRRSACPAGRRSSCSAGPTGARSSCPRATRSTPFAPARPGAERSDSAAIGCREPARRSEPCGHPV